MYKALIAFTALLGLFSFHSYAAPDDGSSCRANAEASQTASVRFIGASSCSDVGSVFTGNDHCQVKATPNATCTQDQFGVWVGEPYYFTGCLAGVDCAEEPTEPTPPPPLPPMELPPPLTAPAITPSDINETNSSSFALNTTNSLLNITNRLNSLTQYLNEDAANIRNALQASTYSINNNISNTNSFIASNTNTILSALSNTQQGIRNYSGQLFSATERNADIRALNLGNKLDTLLENQDNPEAVLQAIDEVKQQVTAIGSTLDDPITREAKHKELLDSIFFSSSDIADIKNYSNESIGLLYQILDSGGGGGDMQQTNDILNGIKTDANNNTNRIVNAVNNSQGLANIENQLMQTNGKLGGLSGQLGQQLDDIKLAIENSPGGGGSIPDDLLDVTNQELSELRQLVAANHTASQAQLQNLNTTASGQSQQLASISTAVSGIGESLDSIKSGLSGSAYESPGMTDTDIKDSLGVGEVVGREDLFTDDIELDSFTGSYAGWLGTSTCPDIPAFDLPFDIQWKLDLKLFCDALGIFGVFVMAAAYFSVPFIVFGGKK